MEEETESYTYQNFKQGRTMEKTDKTRLHSVLFSGYNHDSNEPHPLRSTQTIASQRSTNAFRT